MYFHQASLSETLTPLTLVRTYTLNIRAYSLGLVRHFLEAYFLPEWEAEGEKFLFLEDLILNSRNIVQEMHLLFYMIQIVTTIKKLVPSLHSCFVWQTDEL
jgi:hypothetical protein